MKRCLIGLIFLAAFARADEFTVTKDVPYVADAADAYQAERCRLDIVSPKDAQNLPGVYFGWLALTIVCYMLLTQWMKNRYVRRYGELL